MSSQVRKVSHEFISKFTTLLTMTKRSKSKHDLTEVAYLKVPKAMYLILVGLAGDKMHWSELARDFIEAQIPRALEAVTE